MSTTEQIAVIINEQVKVFDTYKSEIIELAASAKGLTIAGVEDKEGYKIVNEKRKEIKRARVKIEKDGKAIRDILNNAKDIELAAEKELLKELEVETELQKETDRIDAIIESEKEQKRIASENRIKTMQKTLIDLGMVFNPVDSSFAYKGILLTNFDLKLMSDEDFTQFSAGASAQINADKEAEKAEQARIAAEQAAEKKRLEEAKAEADRIESERQKAIAAKEAELAAEAAKQKAEADRIEKEKNELMKEKNTAIFNRLIAAGATADELDFNTLCEMSEQTISEHETAYKLRAEKKAAELKAETERKAKEAEEKAKAEKAEAEAQKSDSVKMKEYIEKLLSVEVPTLKTKKWNTCLSSIIEVLKNY